MNLEKVVLGLDIGVGSVGWGLVKLTEEKYDVERADGTVGEQFKISDGRIIGAGVRTFQLPQDRQKKSLALKRGSARRTRRTTRRKARRMRRLMGLAKEFGLIGEDFVRDEALKPRKGINKKEKWDIWYIRQEALKRKLADIELFRILYHIAKHRGFYFHTKAEEMEKGGKTKEEGKAKAGLARIEKMLEASNWETIGQMFWESFRQTNKDKEARRKRNAQDNYANSIKRLLLKKEVKEIFKAQRRMGNEKSTEELERRYIDEILMHEEGIDEEKLQKMMSRCEFEEGKICAPKESYTSERFTLFNRLNTLELRDTKSKNGRISLDDDQRKMIEELAYKYSEVKFTQVRKALGLEGDTHLRFNLCSYNEKNPEYNKKLECQVEGGQLQFEEKHEVAVIKIHTGEMKTLGEEVKGIFQKRRETWKNAKKLYVYYSDIRKQLNLSGDWRFADLKGYTQTAEELGSEAAYLKQFEEKDTFVKMEGYHKIRKAVEDNGVKEKWGQLKEDGASLDTIAEALTYCKSDATRRDYLIGHGVNDEGLIEAVLTINMKQLARHSKEAMRNLLRYMEKGKLFHEAKEECGYGKSNFEKQAKLEPYHGFFEKNPAVARVIGQALKLINAIVGKYGEDYPIDAIHIEVATELANSEKRKMEMSNGQRRYREEKEAAAERCREAGLNPEEGQNLLMFRLAEQQYQKCPYSGKHITYHSTGAQDEIYIGDCEIDHIIPMSRSFNDSLNNKVLCTQKSNQDKLDRIPFEWFEETYGADSQEWADYARTVDKMYGVPYPKRKNLLRKSWTEEDKERFISRDLNDTRYAARHIADYLRERFDFSRSRREDIKEVSRIQLRSGGVTAFLRHMWGLTKDREENDLHHAQDALVVACSTFGHVYLVSNLAKEIERKGKNWYKHFGRDKFKPWEGIREDIQQAAGRVFVSRMPRHKVTAEGHKDTVVSLKEMPAAKRVMRINKGYAEMGEMVRADVFEDAVGKIYVVPIYAVDIHQNKTLPNQYVPDERTAAYDEWSVVNVENFRFSIFKDDLISINDIMYYVGFFEATTVNVNVHNIDGSAIPDKKEAQDPYTKKICYRPKRKKGKFILKKYAVDMLGNYKEVTKEERLGNRFEKKRPKNGK